MKIIEKLIKRFPKNEEFFKGLEEVEAKKIKVEKVIDIPLRYKAYYLHFEVDGNKFECVLNRDTTFLTLDPQIYNVASIDLAEDIPYANVINILKLLKSKEETTDPNEYDCGPGFVQVANVGNVVFIQQLVETPDGLEPIDVKGKVVKVEYNEENVEYVYHVKIKNSNKVVKTTDVWKY